MEVIMTLRFPALLLTALLLAVASCVAINAVAGKAPEEAEKPGSSSQNPLYVSLIQLIATPDAFDGKHVRVKGFVKIEFEGTAIYLHREDCEQFLTKNGLWQEVNPARAEGSKEAQVNDRYALIEGRFTAKKKGHRELWSGSIEEVTRMEPWEVRKAKK
jgi:hypothetical protein